MHLDSNRREVFSICPEFMDILSEGIDDPDIGIRYAIAHCARSLSRSVEVLRTSVIDSGLGLKIWEQVGSGRLDSTLDLTNVN